MQRYGQIDLARKSLPWEQGSCGTMLLSPTHPRGDDLAILIDSATAIQRLQWFRSHDFRPAEYKVKNYDIIHDILLELKLRSESSSQTLCVKVHGHSGDPLHEEADRLALKLSAQQ